MIDTLVLSGGGIKGAAFIGAYTYLLEKDLIKNIKNIISCSIGSFIAVCISMNISNKLIASITHNVKIDYDLENICISEFSNHGFFDNKIFYSIIKYLLKHKYGIEKISLRDLYDKTKINNEIKIYNYTKKKTEYYNHINNPDMDLALLITASTSIPLLNKYIQYNGDYLLDGGISGSYPVLKNKKYENYIGLCFNNEKILNDPDDIIQYITFLLLGRDDEICEEYKNKKRIIKINTDVSMTDFDISEEKINELIENGYNSIKEFHINNKKYFL
tara:strand:- start:2154 stop:2975 length:822 start_codon:yes stop_codon:yes gene_type:complete